jgi:hypothetical protein
VRWRRVAILIALLGITATRPARPIAGTADLPGRLSDQAFWKLSADASELGGYFRSQDITNLTSNELWFQYVVPDLIQRTNAGRPGTVYLGVGPEQNFTYMAAVRPSMAVIFDIRRGNLDIQLLYKAIFELANDRADFVSLLFARARPSSAAGAPSAAQLFRGLASSVPTEAQYRLNLAAIEERLVKGHGLPLRASDLAGIRAIYRTFFYSGVAGRPAPTKADHQTATDAAGVSHSFLASEAAFMFLKDLESRNMVVPVVGDFAGPKAIRAIGAYLKTQGAVVSAFYLSNVEQYLYQDGKWNAFCRNAATLPLDASSTFIRSTNAGGFGRGGGFVSSLSPMLEDLGSCR